MVSRILKNIYPWTYIHGNDDILDPFDISLAVVNLKVKAMISHQWVKTIEKGRKDRENMQSYLEEES